MRKIYRDRLPADDIEYELRDPPDSQGYQHLTEHGVDVFVQAMSNVRVFGSWNLWDTDELSVHAKMRLVFMPIGFELLDGYDENFLKQVAHVYEWVSEAKGALGILHKGEEVTVPLFHSVRFIVREEWARLRKKIPETPGPGVTKH